MTMRDLSGKRRKGEAVFIFVLLMLCLILLFFRLNARPLWDIDEGMHAATSKDMVLSGDWITPQLNGENFYDKPILFNWFVALSFLLFGFTEFAARFPSALLGFGCVVVTYLLGKRMFGSTASFLGGVILATSPEFVILSRAVVHDMALAFFMTLALFFFYMGFEHERHRRAYFLLFYASAGLAVLAKGPIGLLLPALIIGLFLILKRRLSFLKEMEIGWGIVVFLAVAAPWYVLISLRNKDYFSYFFIQQNLTNFLSRNPSDVRHQQPFYYYFPILIGGFAPWSIFLPLALFDRLRGGLKRLDDAMLFVVIWVGVIFFFFTAASSKLGTYILPLFPAASLIVGSLWHDLLKDQTARLRRGFLLTFVPLLAFSLVGTLYVFVFLPNRLNPEWGVDIAHIGYLALILSGTGILALLFLLKGQHAAFFSTLAGGVVCTILIVILTIIPLVNPYRSTKGLAQALDRMLPPEEKMVFFYRLKDSALFYTDRRATVLKSYDQLIDYLGSDRRVFCIIDRDRFERLEKLKHIGYVLREERGKLLISNKQQPL
jgi:4-amino-4-deoxy-L-arabinose transferase-like glycosyltransferase